MTVTHCPQCKSFLVVQIEAGRGYSCLSCGIQFAGAPLAAAVRDPERTAGRDTLEAKAQAEAPEVGAGLLGHYELVRFLGQGSVGNVFLMRQIVLDRLVAVKVPRAASLTASDVRRLRQEARTLASMSHDNIVGVHDVRIEGNYPYLICEYVEGETLAERIARVRHLSLVDISQMGQQILAGLGAAHAKGIIHRDLKPANIFVTDAGRAKIGDFGLAKNGAVPSDTLPGGLVGTPIYMSPEQSQGQPATFASDLYSTGIILHEMCTGVYPFPGPTIIDYLTQHVNETPGSILVERPELPRNLNQVIQKALQKEPEARFASAEEFHAALADACTHPARTSDRIATRKRAGTSPGTGTSAKPPSHRAAGTIAGRTKVAAAPVRKTRNNTWVLLALGSVPVVASVVFAVAMLKPHPPAKPPPVHVSPRPSVAAVPSPAKPSPSPSPPPSPLPSPSPSPSPSPHAVVPSVQPSPAPSPEETESGSGPSPSPTPADPAALKEAEDQLRLAVKSDPKKAWPHYRLALFLQNNKRFDDAVVEYRQVLKLTPQDATTHSKLGQVFESQNRAAEAEAEMRLAIQYRPDDVTFSTDLASLLWDQRDNIALQVHCSEALAKFPKDAQLHNYHGLALNELGRGREAEIEYRAAIELLPDDAVFLFNLGLLMQEMNRPEAIDAYKRALVVDPQYSDARLRLASLLERKSKGQSLRPGYCARQATGPPDTTRAEDSPTAWTSQGEDDGPEWLELNYLKAMRANCVRVHETFNPGAILSVTLEDEKQVAIATVNVTTTSAPAPRWLEVKFDTTTAKVKWVKLDLDTAKVAGWNQIDAVELVGPDGRAWADDAHASSCYVDENDKDAK